MARRVAVSLALALCAKQAQASSYPLDSVAVPAKLTLQTQYLWYVHSLEDAARKDQGPPSVTFDLKQTGRDGVISEDYIGLQAAILPMADFYKMVDAQQFCTAQGGASAGRLTFKDVPEATKAITHDIWGHGFQKMDLPTDRKSGVYVLVFSNCGGDDAVGVKIEGSVTLKNPHGYLSAHEYPKRLFYMCMVVCYIVATLVWGVLCIQRWPTLLYMQKGLLVVGILGAFESVLWFAMYEICNRIGYITLAIWFAALLSYAFKLMLAFRILIMSTLEHQETVTSQAFCIDAIALSLYMVAELNARTVHGYRFAHDLGLEYIMLNAAPAILMSVSLYAWINMSLLTTTTALKDRSPDLASAYFRSHVLVVISMVGGCLAVAAELFDPTTMEATSWVNHWVCADGARQILFFLMLVGGMAVWFPSDSIAGYAYQQPAQDGHEETIGVLDNGSLDDTEDPEESAPIASG